MPVPAQHKPIQMTLTPAQESYPAGALPEFVVELKNVSDTPVRFCRYRLDYRLKAALVVDGGKGGKDFEAQPFVSQKWTPVKQKDIAFLRPGETLSHRLSFQDDPIFGFLRRAKQPPIIPASNAISGFPPGRYSFNTALSNQVGLYVGRDGFFDHNLEGRKVPDKWPGLEGCFLDLVEATAVVEFR